MRTRTEPKETQPGAPTMPTHLWRSDCAACEAAKEPCSAECLHQASGLDRGHYVFIVDHIRRERGAEEAT